MARGGKRVQRARRNASGGSQDRVTARNTVRGNAVTTRTPAGDANKAGLKGGVKTGAPSALSGMPKPKLGNGVNSPVPTLRKPDRGRGGSR